MLLVVHKQPVIKVLCCRIYDGVLGVSDARVSDDLVEQTMLHTVLPQHLCQAFLVAKLDVTQCIHVNRPSLPFFLEKLVTNEDVSFQQGEDNGCPHHHVR